MYRVECREWILNLLKYELHTASETLSLFVRFSSFDGWLAVACHALSFGADFWLLDARLVCDRFEDARPTLCEHPLCDWRGTIQPDCVGVDACLYLVRRGRRHSPHDARHCV